MEWRLSYCRGTHYSATLRTPGRVKLEGRMNGGQWQEAVSETVPEGLLRIAPDRNAGETWGGGGGTVVDRSAADGVGYIPAWTPP